MIDFPAATAADIYYPSESSTKQSGDSHISVASGTGYEWKALAPAATPGVTASTDLTRLTQAEAAISALTTSTSTLDAAKTSLESGVADLENAITKINLVDAAEQSDDFTAQAGQRYCVDARVKNIVVTIGSWVEHGKIILYDGHRACTTDRTISVTGLINGVSTTVTINTPGGWVELSAQKAAYGYSVDLYILKESEPLSFLPEEGSTLAGSYQEFDWSGLNLAAGSVSGMRLGTAEGLEDIYNGGGLGERTSQIAQQYKIVPVQGSTIYATVIHNDGAGGANQFVRQTYIAPASTPVLTRAQRILASPDFIGPGRFTTGAPLDGNGDPIITKVITNLNDSGAGSYRDAMTTTGAYITADPELEGTGKVLLDSTVDVAADITYDLEDVFLPIAPNPEATNAINIARFRQGNAIVIGLVYDGNGAEATTGNHTGPRFHREDHYMCLGCETIGDCQDDTFGIGDASGQPENSARYVTFGYYKAGPEVGKGLTMNQDNKVQHDNGRVTTTAIFCSDLGAADRNPNNSGGFAHVFNCYVHGYQYGPNRTTNKDTSIVDAETLSENNYYEDAPTLSGTKAHPEQANDSGSNQSPGGQLHYTRGCFYASTVDASAHNSSTIDLDESNAQLPQNIDNSYPYTLIPASEVKAAVLSRAGRAYYVA